MSTYAIGDIHGCLKALESIFTEQNFAYDDTIVFLGDYVDRGPNSRQVIDMLLTKSDKHSCIFLRGNHEIMMMESRLSRSRFREWLGFGGAQTLESYGLKNGSKWDEKISQAHWQFLENTKSYHVIDDNIFVHAGLEMSVPLESQDPLFLFWKKFEVPEPYSKTRRVFCGHTARKSGEIADFGHTICLDTYAYGGKWLSCLNVDTNEFIQANNVGDIYFGSL